MTNNDFRFNEEIFIQVFGTAMVANATLVEFPENKIILESKSPKTIDMACKSDSQDKLRWFVRKNRDSEREMLYSGYFLRPDAKSYCTVTTDEPGKYNLRLENTAEAAQTYICLDPGTLAEASADLIWLSDQICRDSSTEDLVNLTCCIEFRGNWAPTMEWKEHSSNGEKVLLFGVNTETFPNQLVSSTLVLPMQNGSKNYTCTTKFDINGKPPHTTATNVPVYNQEWMTSVLTKSQDHPPIALIVATATIVPIAIAAISIALVVLKKNMRAGVTESSSDQNQGKKQRSSSESSRTGLLECLVENLK